MIEKVNISQALNSLSVKDDADLLFGPEPEPIYKQLFEQPQTEGEDYFMYSVVFMSTGTFAE